MIHPVTCICFVMALGSGLYLYQSKHDAQVLDRTIEKTVHDTDQIRDQTRALRTEWTLLNEPERLRQLAEQYLPNLKPVAPPQFTSLADLDSRLPAPRAIVPEPSPVPVAEAAPAVDPAAGDVASEVADTLPLPPMPPPASVAVASASMPGQGATAASPRSADQRPADQRATDQRSTDQRAAAERRPAVVPPRPVVPAALVQPQAPRVAAPEPRPVDMRPTEIRQAELRPAESRPPEQARVAEARPAAPQRAIRVAAPQTLPAVPAPTPMQGGGSLLGMAHGAGGASAPLPVPMPRPTPVNSWSSQFSNGGG
ncbi:MAG: hypothetical protein P4L71_20265 [Acetobacteraceae bacterium]|nr:hypothetical protein [Acetobacteraceae bacterium]